MFLKSSFFSFDAIASKQRPFPAVFQVPAVPQGLPAAARLPAQLLDEAGPRQGRLPHAQQGHLPRQPRDDGRGHQELPRADLPGPRHGR